MNIIVTEKVRQELTQKYEIHPDKTWSVMSVKRYWEHVSQEQCERHYLLPQRIGLVALATQQSQRNSELEKPTMNSRARVSTLDRELNLKKRQKLMWK